MGIILDTIIYVSYYYFMQEVLIIYIEDNMIKTNAEEFNNVLEEFVKFSCCFHTEHEKDIDLIMKLNKY